MTVTYESSVTPAGIVRPDRGGVRFVARVGIVAAAGAGVPAVAGSGRNHGCGHIKSYARRRFPVGGFGRRQQSDGRCSDCECVHQRVGELRRRLRRGFARRRQQRLVGRNREFVEEGVDAHDPVDAELHCDAGERTSTGVVEVIERHRRMIVEDDDQPIAHTHECDLLVGQAVQVEQDAMIECDDLGAVVGWLGDRDDVLRCAFIRIGSRRSDRIFSASHMLCRPVSRSVLP